ncbi:FIST signal transduction protein [Desulfopila aestuarii]|nr:FIST N-terminal domain-containing protein [Desulfopila aestuarii]
MKSAMYYSHDTDSFLAGRDAMREVVAKMAGVRPELLLLFSSIGHDLPRVLEGIGTVAGPDIPLCGCTGSGIISAHGSDEATHSIVLMGLAGSNLSISPFLFSGLQAEPEAIGEQIAIRVREAGIGIDDRALLLLFADGLTINADKLYRGLHSSLPSHIDVVGGTAGNDFQQNITYQFCNGRVVSDGVCGVLLHGDFRYTIGVTHGSRPLGLSHTITRAEGNVIWEIDHVPALDVLKKFLGVERVQDVSQILNLFEIGEEFPGQGYCENILNRAIINVEEAGGLRLAVEIPEGTRVRITRRDRRLILQRTREMTETMTRELQDWRSATYLYFNCSGRGSYLFGSPEPDVDMVREVLTPESRMIGFFTFGEFAPINNRNYFHNFTGVLVGME